jgi:hypothetical protein
VSDAVNHPQHYQSAAKCSKCAHPIECIDVTKHLSFLRGNAMKYLWRADKKGKTLEDLKKARWYIDAMIAELEGKKEEIDLGDTVRCTSGFLDPVLKDSVLVVNKIVYDPEGVAADDEIHGVWPDGEQGYQYRKDFVLVSKGKK